MKDSHPNFGKETSSTEDYKDIEFLQWLVFFLLIALIPCTIWLYKKLNPKPIPKQFDCTCEGCEKKSDEKIKLAKLEMASTANKIKIALIGGLWALFLVLLYIVLTSNTPPAVAPYNPYDILEIQQGSTVDEIKRAHKKLSLKYHPDKNPDNAEAEEKYMAIAKAYQTLTDDGTREKWEKYGNPDGPQRMSIGIALPSWLINKGNSPIVLSVYLLLLVVALPTAVYYWNKGTASKGPAQIEQQSMALYYHAIDGQTRLKSMIEILAATTEYKAALPERKSDDENLKNLYKSIPDAYKVKKARFNAPYIVKGTVLLYAHMCRIKDMPETLKEDLNQILKTYRHYLTGAFQLTREKRQLVGLVELVKLSQCIMQSAWEDQQLKQLPHIDGFISQSLKGNNISDIAKFKSLTEEKRKELLNKVGGTTLTDRKIKDIESILAKIPCQVGVKCKITTEDPKALASSVCTLEVEFVDTFALKKQKQEEAAAALLLKEQGKHNNNKSTTPTTTPSSSSPPTPAEKKGGARKRIVSKRSKDSNNATTTDDQKQQDNEDQEETTEEKKKEKKSFDLSGAGNGVADSDDDSDFDDDEYSDSDDDDAWEKVPKKSLINPGDKEICHTPFTFDDKPVSYWILMGNRQKNELVAIGRSETYAPGTIVKYPFLSAAEVGNANYSVYVLCDGYLGCDVETELSIHLSPNPRPLMLQSQSRPPQQQIPPPQKINPNDPDSDDEKQEKRSTSSPSSSSPSPSSPPQQSTPSPPPQPLPEILPPAIQSPASPSTPTSKPLTQKQKNQQEKLLKKQMKAAASGSSSPLPKTESKKNN